MEYDLRTRYSCTHEKALTISNCLWHCGVFIFHRHRLMVVVSHPIVLRIIDN